jgi:ABC-type xylose transport system substrate-binding protein|tara:strand:- start:235 stop:483 length:249 start_codon:yes stop_codon:yes gene_type:complete
MNSNDTNLNSETVQTAKKFSLNIEHIARDKEISHMDAVLDYCFVNNIEPDTVGRLITKALKEKIEANARELNYLERQAQLPI